MAYSSINPFTERLVQDYPSHSAEQVEQACRRPMRRFGIQAGAATWTAGSAG